MAIKQTKQQLHTEEVKEKILGKAEELFTTYGVEKVSMKELASELGFTTGTVYHHFESKDDILDNIAKRHAAASAIKFEDYLSADDSVQAVRDFFGEEMLGRIRTDGMVFTKYRVLNLVDPRRKNRLERFVGELLSEAVDKGQLKPDTDTDRTAEVLFALYREIGYEYVITDGDSTVLDHLLPRIDAVLGPLKL